MKKLRLTLLTLTFLTVINTQEVKAQSKMNKFIAGHKFEIQLPDYLIKTGGLNNSASIQFKNTVKEVYG